MKGKLITIFLLSFALKMNAQTSGNTNSSVTLPGNELNTKDSTKKQDSIAGKTVGASGTKTDSTTTKKKEPKPPYIHQLRFNLDVARLATNFIYPDKKGFEFAIDYKLRGKNYLVAEGGWGKNKVDYTNLQYDNTGSFIKLGIDKNVVDVLNDKDFDVFFIGIRYGMGFGQRSTATFLVPSYFGPPEVGTSEAENYLIHWGEINAGVRVEILENWFVGWNVRVKFLLNAGEFKTLAPSYAPGYGKGDKSTFTGANLYLAYALRWKK